MTRSLTPGTGVLFMGEDYSVVRVMGRHDVLIEDSYGNRMIVGIVCLERA